MDDKKTDFRTKILEIRNKSGLSQQEFADRLEVSRQTVSRWEAGKSVPSANQIANLCRMFHLDANDFIQSGNKDVQLPPDNRQERNEPVGKRAKIFAAIGISVFLFLFSSLLIATVVYAIKDSAFDTVNTVLIMSIPKNTPMIVLSVTLFLFIVILILLLVFLFRRERK